MELVFFLEELSAKVFLDEFLPRWLPEGIDFRTIPHNGKSDLQKSLPRKLRAWQNPNAHFIVLHDKDKNDCITLKQDLRKICEDSRKDVEPLIRIACHELEAWYLGDFVALAEAFPDFAPQKHMGKAKYREVDALSNAAEELTKIVPAYQKVSGSRRIGKVMKCEANTSQSFTVFIAGIKRIIDS